MTGTIRANHIVTEVKLSEGGVMLNRFANSDAAVNPSFVVGHIKDE